MKTSKTAILLFLLMTLVGFLVSCNPEKDALDDLYSLTQKLEGNSANFSQEQWDNAIKQYDEICHRIQQYDSSYTAAQQEEIGRLKGKCQSIFIRHAIEDGLGGFMKTLWQYKGLFDGAVEGLNGLLEGL